MSARDIFDTNVMPRFEESRADWLERARAAASRIARENGTVTINDVRAVCPPPDGVDPRVMGAVFSRRSFERVEMANSDRRECHGRPICVFRLRTGAKHG